jgi:hypothetical protein
VKTLLDTKKYNCVIIDIKDDVGRIPVEINTKKTKKYNSIRSNWKISSLLELLKKYKIYKIARIVTFKDYNLFSKENYKFAIKDKYTKKPWLGAHDDKWVDPHNRDVWKYNLEIAKKTIEIGFNEIQFDYIRFPSDGAIHRIHFPAKKNNIYKSEVLASFLAYVRSQISVPISIDIYGYHALYRIGNPIGQNMQLLGEYVDAVSPMVYSSHFGDSYLSGGPLQKRVYNLIYHCTYRANTYTRGRFIIRNWLQAFKMKTGLWGWGKYYFDGQTKGTKDGGSDGYMWWGPIELFKEL